MFSMSEENDSEKDIKSKKGDSPSTSEKLTPILLIASVLLAFAVGVLWQKVSFLEKGKTPSGTTNGTGQAQAESPISVTQIKKMAKDLKLDEKKFNTCLDGGKYAETVKKDLTYGESVGVRGTPAFFINGRFLGGAFPFESFKEIIDKELAGKGSDNYKDYSETLQKAYSPDKPEERSFEPKAKSIDIGDSPVLGESGAKVTIVEFSDFECPYCARHFTQTWPKIKSEYLDKGLIKLIFKNYPLTFHTNAQKAAEAAECAKEQGKFWEMHDKLFQASAGAS